MCLDSFLLSSILFYSERKFQILNSTVRHLYKGRDLILPHIFASHGFALLNNPLRNYNAFRSFQIVALLNSIGGLMASPCL
jgi:hypothetical protein